MLVDAAHNPHGARALAGALGDEFRFTRLVGVVGVMADKDARGMLAELEPVVHEVVVTPNSSPRSMDADELAARRRRGLRRRPGERRAAPAEAIEAAVELAEEAGESGGGVVITGSVVTAGEARGLFGKRPE